MPEKEVVTIDVNKIRNMIEEDFKKIKEIISLKQSDDFEKTKDKLKKYEQWKEDLEKAVLESKNPKGVKHSLIILSALVNFTSSLLKSYSSKEDDEKKKLEELELKRKAKLELVKKNQEEKEKRVVEQAVRKELSKEDEEKIKIKVEEEVKKRKVGRPRKV